MNYFSGLQPWLRPYADYLLSFFPRLTVTSVYRSYTEQLRLWNTRASNPFPVAPPGKSLHQYGLAWDMTGPDADLEYAGRVWNSWGGRWSPADKIHFEVRVS